MIRRALVSVSDKRGVVELGKVLAELGIEILSTGGTASALTAAGIAVTQVSTFTGAPEILDGRVKTLHPKIHGGLLGRDTDAHRAEMAANAISPIDLVVVNLYPFEATIAKPDVALRRRDREHRYRRPVDAALGGEEPRARRRDRRSR